MKEWYAPQDITARISRSPSASVVLEVLESQHGNPALNLICISAAWVKIAKLPKTMSPQVAADPYWKEFIESTARILKQSLFQDVSKCAWACSNMFWASGSLKTEPLVWPYLAEVQEDLREGIVATSYFMDSQQVSYAIWACAKLELRTSALEETLDPLIRQFPNVVEYLDSQQASMILWAAGKLGPLAPQLLKGMTILAEVLPEKISNFKAEEVSSSLLSISLISEHTSSLLEQVPGLAKRAAEVLQKMNGQMLANTCWGLAVCGHVDARLCKVI